MFRTKENPRDYILKGYCGTALIPNKEYPKKVFDLGYEYGTYDEGVYERGDQRIAIVRETKRIEDENYSVLNAYSDIEKI